MGRGPASRWCPTVVSHRFYLTGLLHGFFRADARGKNPVFTRRRSAWLRLGACFILAAGAGDTVAQLASSAAPADPIQSVRKVQALSLEELAGQPSAALRGVITYADTWDYPGFFLHDGTAAIYVDNHHRLPVEIGQEVRLSGPIMPGRFAPQIQLRQLTHLGRGTLPAPEPVTFAQLSTGAWDSQWVKVTGVVRSSVARPDGRTHLEVQLDSGRLEVITGTPLEKSAAEIVDAIVQLTGNCYSMAEHRQFLGAWLAVPTAAHLTLLDPPPADPWAIPSVSIVSLGRFQPAAAPVRRIKIRHPPRRPSWPHLVSARRHPFH